MLNLQRRLYVLPCYAGQQVGDRCNGNIKHTSQTSLAISLGEHGFDVPNVLFGQLCGATSPSVFGLRDWFQMIRVHTRRVSAKMVECIAFRYRAILLFVIVAMWGVGFLVNLNALGVAFRRFASLPNPTSGIWIDNIVYVAQLPSVRVVSRQVAHVMACLYAACMVAALCNWHRSPATTHTQAGWVRWFANSFSVSLSSLQFALDGFFRNIEKPSGLPKAICSQTSNLDKVKNIGIGNTEQCCYFCWAHILTSCQKVYYRIAHCGNTKLSAAQRTALWNGGAGLAYADFTA